MVWRHSGMDPNRPFCGPSCVFLPHHPAELFCAVMQVNSVTLANNIISTISAAGLHSWRVLQRPFIQEEVLWWRILKCFHARVGQLVTTSTFLCPKGKSMKALWSAACAFFMLEYWNARSQTTVWFFEPAVRDSSQDGVYWNSLKFAILLL